MNKNHMNHKFLIVDDHELVLEGTHSSLQKQYPNATISIAESASEAQEKIDEIRPDVAIVDLSIPRYRSSNTEAANTEIGLDLLRWMMENHPEDNIVVQSANVMNLVRIKPGIDNHGGGFTIVDKAEPLQTMLMRIDWSLEGVIYTRPIPSGGMKKEWIRVLELAFNECLTDAAIAEEMHVAVRTVFNYWSRARDVLGIYPEERENIRIKTLKMALEKGYLLPN